MQLRVSIAVLLALLVLAAPAWGAFPGRNGKIAFYTQRDGLPNTEIYSMNPDGSAQTNLTRSPTADYGPEWSSDGSRIAFLTKRDGVDPYYTDEIYTMNADGSGQQRLTATASDEKGVTWSPDGSRIAFDRLSLTLDGRFEDNRDIWVMNASGGGEVLLLDGPAHDRGPAWSPDGTKIAFSSTRDGNGEVYVMNSDGTNLKNLTGHPAPDGGPEWSPDGKWIAFVRSDGCCPTDPNIYVMRSDGSGQVRLTTGPGSERRDFDPAWSPDGTMIAFSSNGGQLHRDIHVMNADGSNPVNIANDPTVADGPTWQPLPNQLPDCSRVTPSIPELAPPNHMLVPVSLSGATDPDGDVVTLTITTVTQDEPVGDRPDAIIGSPADRVRLRAERDGGGDGRVYRIAFTAADGHGGTCSGQTRVGVPKGGRPALDSAPPSFDSR